MGNFWVIYLTSKGYTLSTAALLDIVFWAALFVFEIPTGYIADYFGRRASLFLSYIFQSLGVFVFAIATSLNMFLLSYAIWGFSLTLQSGAEEAWIYDQLVAETGDETSFQRVYGNLIGLGFISSAITGIAAGFIAEFELVYTIYATSVIFIIASIWIMTIPHTYVSNKDKEDKPGVMVGFLALRGFKSLVLLQVLINMGTLIVFFWFQTYLDDAGVRFLFIGFILSLGAILVSVGGRFTDSLSRKIGNNGVFILPMLAGLFVVSMSFGVGAAIIGYWLIHVFRGLWMPMFSRSVNNRVKSNIRATVLSIMGALGTIFILAGEIASAIFIETFGYDLMFFVLGIILFCVFSLLYFVARGNYAKEIEVEGISST